ncbi:hypothetical protein CCHL11_05417 [Colletotrichum chlorophyti]|uniref:C3H1-type domain-containing protein n=1 Tax=Colletotrichum chlorophyti TaxID=708187 RepID=A0A1Q8RNS2_9PEZI|nr:hypothetical protein CCHL11_05417 [Colletotrichum chlorophyti]
MDSTLNPSSSDRSYSPPVSQASTRDTTPDFDPSVASTGISSLRIGGHAMEGSHTIQVEAQRRNGEKSPTDAFRRYNHQQQRAPMRQALANAPAPRSTDSQNWRMHMGTEAAGHYAQGQIQGHGRGQHLSLSSASGSEYVAMSSPMAEHETPAPGAHTGGEWTGFHSYCLDRGNGNYTRLIPADLLPPLVGILAVQYGHEGMLILPTPRGLDPQNPLGNVIQPVEFKKRIDHIVASSPVPPKKPKIYCDKWVHEGVCAFTQQGCKYKHEMPLDKATQHSLGLFHGLPSWWKKQQAEIQRQQRQENGFAEFFDAHQPQQCSMPSPMNSDQVLASPARSTQSWRKVEEVETQRQKGFMPPPTRQAGGYKGSVDPRMYQHSLGSPTSPCVWGPIGPPSKQPGHAQVYHQNLGGYRTPSNLALLSSLEENLGERGASSRF